MIFHIAACMSLAVQRTEYLNVSHYRHAPAEIIAADMLAACADGCQLPVAGHLRAVSSVVLAAIEHQWRRVQFVAGAQQAAAAGRFVAVVRGAGHASAKHWAHAA